MKIVAGEGKRKSEILGGPVEGRKGGEPGEEGQKKEGPNGVPTHPRRIKNIFFVRNVKINREAIEVPRKEAERKENEKNKEKQKTQNRTHKELFLVFAWCCFFCPECRSFVCFLCTVCLFLFCPECRFLSRLLFFVPLPPAHREEPTWDHLSGPHALLQGRFWDSTYCLTQRLRMWRPRLMAGPFPQPASSSRHIL